MENSKKITVSWSDITPSVNKSSKVYPKIGICKNEKIDFFLTPMGPIDEFILKNKS